MPRRDDVKKVMRRYADVLSMEELPSAPNEMIVVKEDPFRPQPRLDRDTHDGMTTTVGRIREDEVLENGIKYLLVSHNTKMGAAKGAVLLAEPPPRPVRGSQHCGQPVAAAAVSGRWRHHYR